MLVATLCYKKLWQLLDYILGNMSLGCLLFGFSSVFTLFIASCQGYVLFGCHVCALEAFLDSAAGTAGEGDLGEAKAWNQGPGCWVRAGS